MPGSCRHQRVDATRGRIKPWLGIARGLGECYEGRVLKLSREVLRCMTTGEKTAFANHGDWPERLSEEVVRDAWETGKRDGEFKDLLPGPPGAPADDGPDAVPLRHAGRHLNTRAAECWCKVPSHRKKVQAAARRAKKTAKYATWTLEKLKKKFSADYFVNLARSDKEKYIIEAAQGSRRVRVHGQWRSAVVEPAAATASVPDELPLAALALMPEPAPEGCTPTKARRSGFEAAAPLKLGHAGHGYRLHELAAVGRKFLHAGNAIVSDAPAQASNGMGHFVRRLTSHCLEGAGSLKNKRSLKRLTVKQVSGEYDVLGAIAGAKASRGQRGRGPTVTDDQLRELLAPNLAESRSLSKRAGGQMQLLTTTLARIHRSNPAVRGALAYSTLCHRTRVHCPKMGVGRARKRVDRCPICVTWDTHVAPAGRAALDAAHARLAAKQTGYWTGFVHDATFKNHDLDDIDFVRATFQWLKEGSSRRGVRDPALEGAEQYECDLLAPILRDVELWAPHWQLRNASFNALHEDLRSTEEGAIYLWMDWAANPACLGIS